MVASLIGVRPFGSLEGVQGQSDVESSADFLGTVDRSAEDYG